MLSFPPNQGEVFANVANVLHLDGSDAMALTKAKHQDVSPEYEKDVIATQLLATMAYLQETKRELLQKNFNYLVGATGNFDQVLSYLIKGKLVNLENDRVVFNVFTVAGFKETNTGEKRSE